MKRIMAVGTALALTACTPPTPVAQPVAAVPVAASFARTWSAIVDVLAERSINARTVDRASGLVAVTTAFPFDTLKKYTTNCGSWVMQMQVQDAPASTHYSIVAKGDSTNSTVRVTTQMVVDFGSGTTLVCNSNQKFEQGIESDIKARAEAR